MRTGCRRRDVPQQPSAFPVTVCSTGANWRPRAGWRQRSGPLTRCSDVTDRRRKVSQGVMTSARSARLFVAGFVTLTILVSACSAGGGSSPSVSPGLSPTPTMTVSESAAPPTNGPTEPPSPSPSATPAATGLPCDRSRLLRHRRPLRATLKRSGPARRRYGHDRSETECAPMIADEFWNSSPEMARDVDLVVVGRPSSSP